MDQQEEPIYLYLPGQISINNLMLVYQKNMTLISLEHLQGGTFSPENVLMLQMIVLNQVS